MRVLIPLLTLFVALHAAIPAHAHVYKWVDQNGVTHYASTPPADARTAKKLDSAAQRVSVYTPDAALTLAMAAGARSSDRILSDRIDSLERQLEAERRARQNAAAAELLASQTAYERCMAERRLDCNSSYHPYPPVVAAAIPRRQPRFIPTVPVTGATAGNVTDVIASGGAGFDRTPGAFPGRAFAVSSAPAGRQGRGFAVR